MKKIIDNCTFCNKSFDNFKTEIKFITKTHRRTEQHTWEQIGNLDIESVEIVCEECFNEFINTFKKSINKVND